MFRNTLQEIIVSIEKCQLTELLEPLDDLVFKYVFTEVSNF